jgi:glycosyltransferase involved in cell wall biosynthesis
VEQPGRVLLVYADRVGAAMGGMGIRAVELGRVLRDALGAEVTIAAAAADAGDVGLPVVTFDPHAPAALEPHLRDADAVVAQPGWPQTMRRLSRSGARLVFDLYDPEVFGTLEHFAGRRRRGLMAAFAADRVVDALARGDHAICASERQRDLWIGAMVGAGLVASAAYDHDPTLRSALDVVPYGVPTAPPAAAGHPVRERFGLAADDEIVLWNGGLWSWLDAPAAIRAVARLRERRPRARLVFMGASDAPPARRATEQARAVADRLGLLGDGVHFNDGWVPYAARGGWLLDADCAVSAHAEHLETRFAFRTRVLDCFWGGLPVVCTDGDELAVRVAREDLGAIAPPGDDAALAAGLERVLERGRGAYAAPLAAAAADHAWPRVAAPLVRMLRGPAPPRARRSAPRAVRRAAYLALTGSRLRPPRAG